MRATDKIAGDFPCGHPIAEGNIRRRGGARTAHRECLRCHRDRQAAGRRRRGQASDSRERILRTAARSVGMTVRRRGPSYTLIADDVGEELIVGDIESVEAYLKPLLPQSKPTGSSRPYVGVHGWDGLIAAYLLVLASGGYTRQTLRFRRKSLEFIARGLNAPAAEVTGAHLVEWFGAQTQWGRSARKQYRATARGFFIWAYQNGHVPVHIADDLPSVRDHYTVPKPVPDHLVQQALELSPPRTALMIRLAAEAGLRRDEISRVRVSDLIETASGFSLKVLGKGEKPRAVPVSDDLAAIIQAGAAGHTPSAQSGDWLFPGNDEGHISAGQVGRLVSRVLPAGYSTHKLRHRYATTVFRGSRNIRAVQVLLGHSSVATTQRYTAVDDDEIRAAAMTASNHPPSVHNRVVGNVE